MSENPVSGVLPSQALEQMIASGAIRARTPILPEQVQPSRSTCASAEAYRVRASFLAAGSATVTSKLEQYRLHTLDLTRSVLEKGCVYIVPLQEELALPAAISGKANPKSSTAVSISLRVSSPMKSSVRNRTSGVSRPSVRGVVPRTFSVVVRQGERLSQLRLFQGATSLRSAPAGD